MVTDPNNFSLFQWLWGMLLLPLGFLFKRTNENTQHTNKVRQHMAENYVAKTDYREDAREIRADLKLIIAKLDRKADRDHHV